MTPTGLPPALQPVGGWTDGRRAGPDRPQPPRPITDTDIDRLVRIVELSSADAGRVLVDGLLAHGRDRASVICDLLGGAARRIGDLWIEDRMSFAKVTVSVGRLQALLRGVARPCRQEPRQPSDPAVLLAPFPPEQHVFGLAIVEEFFRSAGWRVTPMVDASVEALERALARTSFDVVGLSLSSVDLLADASPVIARLRNASANPDLAVILGGPPFACNPALGRELGADASAADAREAVSLARGLLAGVRQRARPADEACGQTAATTG